MKKCKCGNAVASNAKFCTKCGHRFTSGFTKFVALMVVVFGFFVIIAIITASNSGSATSGPVAAQKPQPASAPTGPPAKPKTPAQLTAQQVAARKAYAAVIDQQLLDMSIESKTFTQGTQAKTMVIQDVLAGRVRMHALGQNSTVFSQLRALGFTHLRYTNSFESDLNETYDWDLTKN
jgi:hypothetical protein